MDQLRPDADKVIKQRVRGGKLEYGLIRHADARGALLRSRYR